MAGETVNTGGSVPTVQQTTAMTPTWYDQLSQQFGNTASGALSNLNSLGTDWYADPTIASFTNLQNKAINSAGNPNTGASQLANAGGALSNYQQTYNPTGTTKFLDPTAYGAVKGMTGAYDWQSPLDAADNALGMYQTRFDPSQLSSFMDPYTNSAVQSMYQLSNRNLLENVLPQVNSTFTGNGQYGSSRNSEFTSRALRDNALSADQTAAGMLNNQFNNAMQQQYQWNQAPLTLASAYSGLGQTGAGIANQTASNLSGMNTTAQGQQYQWNQNPLSAASAYGNLGALSQNMDWNTINNQYNLGNQQQQTQQKGLDTAYNQWLQSLQLPTQQMGALSQMIPNFTYLYRPQQTTTTAALPQASSGADNLTGALGILSALFNSNGG